MNRRGGWVYYYNYQICTLATTDTVLNLMTNTDCKNDLDLMSVVDESHYATTDVSLTLSSRDVSTSDNENSSINYFVAAESIAGILAVLLILSITILVIVTILYKRKTRTQAILIQEQAVKVKVAALNDNDISENIAMDENISYGHINLSCSMTA